MLILVYLLRSPLLTRWCSSSAFQAAVQLIRMQSPPLIAVCPLVMRLSLAVPAAARRRRPEEGLKLELGVEIGGVKFMHTEERACEGC